MNARMRRIASDYEQIKKNFSNPGINSHDVSDSPHVRAIKIKDGLYTRPLFRDQLFPSFFSI